MLNLVPFTEVGSNFDAKFSVRPNGTVGVSSGALKRFDLLKQDTHVLLFYDKDAQIVGVKPTTDDSIPGAIKLIVRQPKANSQQKQPSGHFSAKAFLQFHDIPYKDKKTQSYDAEWSDQYDMILFDLSKPRNVSRASKKAEQVTPVAETPPASPHSVPPPTPNPAPQAPPSPTPSQPPMSQDDDLDVPF
ncbi:hypothetical protein [Tichowtungia aerotolerans]|uniref:Uncharacterized protein n=1 Tax=Tichowtungia aerotolerans TaxID=2697043 RepID=A0A6P1MHE6_9BACT|nr:hypothetical protein [Tichowtungia aerotolerans]QHI70495.1 hypothetical protein GT409_13950 [Tichowtungia aerotolerans]